MEKDTLHPFYLSASSSSITYGTVEGLRDGPIPHRRYTSCQNLTDDFTQIQSNSVHQHEVQERLVA